MHSTACLRLSEKFKDISDEVPCRSLRNPWQQGTAGSCGWPGLQALSGLSRTKKKTAVYINPTVRSFLRYFLHRVRRIKLRYGDFSVSATATAAEDTCLQQRADRTRDYSYRFYYKAPPGVSVRGASLGSHAPNPVPVSPCHDLLCPPASTSHSLKARGP